MEVKNNSKVDDNSSVSKPKPSMFSGRSFGTAKGSKLFASKEVMSAIDNKVEAPKEDISNEK